MTDVAQGRDAGHDHRPAEAVRARGDRHAQRASSTAAASCSSRSIPENGVDLHELLGPLGVKLHLILLANEQAFARRTHQDSDHANIVTASFSSHPTMSTLLKLGSRAPLILPGAGLGRVDEDRQAERRHARHADARAAGDVRGQERQLQEGPGRGAARVRARRRGDQGRGARVRDRRLRLHLGRGDPRRRQRPAGARHRALARRRRGLHRARPTSRPTCRSPTPASRTSSGSTRRSS